MVAVTYLLPGILLMAIASGIAYTAYRLFMWFLVMLPADKGTEKASSPAVKPGYSIDEVSAMMKAAVREVLDGQR